MSNPTLQSMAAMRNTNEATEHTIKRLRHLADALESGDLILQTCAGHDVFEVGAPFTRVELDLVALRPPK